MVGNADINIDIRFYTSDQSHTQFKVSGLLNVISRLKVSLLSVDSSYLSSNLVIENVALNAFCSISSAYSYLTYSHIPVNSTGSWSYATFIYLIRGYKGSPTEYMVETDLSFSSNYSSFTKVGVKSSSSSNSYVAWFNYFVVAFNTATSSLNGDLFYIVKTNDFATAQDTYLFADNQWFDLTGSHVLYGFSKIWVKTDLMDIKLIQEER